MYVVLMLCRIGIYIYIHNYIYHSTQMFVPLTEYIFHAEMCSLMYDILWCGVA